MTGELIKDIVQWDTKSWSKAVKYWDKHVDWDTVQNGLELGGREGGLSLFLALKGKEVVCSDLEDVEKTASPLHLKHGVSSLIKYQDIDATNIPYENHFDVIMFKSIIGGIGRNDQLEVQKKVFKEIYKALKPGGKLLFAENLIASRFHQKLRKKFIPWGNTWRYISLDELDVFLEDFASCEVKTTGVLATFGRSEGQRSFMAMLDGLLLNWISPKSAKYIAYGIAGKKK